MPFVIESCGLFHPVGLKLLTDLAQKKESGLQCKVDTIKNYCLKWLSVSLQNAIARSMELKYLDIVRDDKMESIISDSQVFNNTENPY